MTSLTEASPPPLLHFPREVAGLRLPDSAVCRAATQYAQRVSEPYLFHHVMRTYVFAELAGRTSERQYDPELLYLASVLHDLGLTDEAEARTRFEVEGADMAKRFLGEQGMAERDIELVWEAVALHSTPVIPQRMRPEIALCQLGAGIDGGAVPRAMLSRALVEEVLEQWPRLGFKGALRETLEKLYRRGPAAAESYVVSDVCERDLAGFHRPSFCDVLVSADFPE